LKAYLFASRMMFDFSVSTGSMMISSIRAAPRYCL
jgi:hypothetical protein